jgi:hypothetical protein
MVPLKKVTLKVDAYPDYEFEGTVVSFHHNRISILFYLLICTGNC